MKRERKRTIFLNRRRSIKPKLCKMEQNRFRDLFRRQGSPAKNEISLFLLTSFLVEIGPTEVNKNVSLFCDSRLKWTSLIEKCFFFFDPGNVMFWDFCILSEPLLADLQISAMTRKPWDVFLNNTRYISRTEIPHLQDYLLQVYDAANTCT